MLLRQRQVSNKLNLLLICASENAIFVSECLGDTHLVKNGSSMYLGDDGVKESVIKFIFSIRMNGLQTACSPLKGQGCGEAHVTLTEEWNDQC